MKCHYKKNHTSICSGPVIVTIHDPRGCVDVCLGHAQWRFTTSMAFGLGASSHSANCKHEETRR